MQIAAGALGGNRVLLPWGRRSRKSRTYFAAVEAELDSWDTYLERLQTNVAATAWNARTQAETAIAEVRTRRIAVEEHLAHARDHTDDAWQEQRKRVTAARDELEQNADELSTKFN